MKHLIRKDIRKKMNRSGSLVCPICKEKHILVEHHINGREILNANQPFNIANICSNCHNEVHHGKIVIEGWFSTSNGRELLWHYSNELSLSGQDSKPHIIG